MSNAFRIMMVIMLMRSKFKIAHKLKSFLIIGLLKRGLVNPDRLVHTLLALMKRMIDLIIICVETLKQVCRCLLENKFTERGSLRNT